MQETVDRRVTTSPPGNLLSCHSTVVRSKRWGIYKLILEFLDLQNLPFRSALVPPHHHVHVAFKIGETVKCARPREVVLSLLFSHSSSVGADVPNQGGYLRRKEHRVRSACGNGMFFLIYFFSRVYRKARCR